MDTEAATHLWCCKLLEQGHEDGTAILAGDSSKSFRGSAAVTEDHGHVAPQRLCSDQPQLVVGNLLKLQSA